MVRKRLGDLDHLLFGYTQSADRRARIDTQTNAVENLLGLTIELVLVEKHAQTAARLAADEHVLRDGQMMHQVEFLMDDTDARCLGGARARKVDRLAVI